MFKNNYGVGVSKAKKIAKRLGETLKNTVKTIFNNKSFYLGIIFAVGLFSQYIFGADNLAEQIAEQVYKMHTGNDVDFSPELDSKPL